LELKISWLNPGPGVHIEESPFGAIAAGLK